MDLRKALQHGVTVEILEVISHAYLRDSRFKPKCWEERQRDKKGTQGWEYNDVIRQTVACEASQGFIFRLQAVTSWSFTLPT